MITGSRLLTGAGHPLQVPAIDLAEVGAGGGSIIRRDAGGGLLVGPSSAGAVPGPACYGRGGKQPTITDAAAALGYLNPVGIAGGAIPIDVAAARAALHEEIAEPLGISVEDAAYAAIRIASATMLRALRAVSSERGRDPRDYAVCVFGGNGPLFGPLLAAELGATRVVVPPHPGIFSAVGLLMAEIECEAAETVRADVSTLAPAKLAEIVERLEGHVRAELTASGLPAQSQVTERRLSLRYAGQTHALTIVMRNASIDVGTLCAASEAFGAEHERHLWAPCGGYRALGTDNCPDRWPRPLRGRAITSQGTPRNAARFDAKGLFRAADRMAGSMRPFTSGGRPRHRRAVHHLKSTIRPALSRRTATRCSAHLT
jgi:N-methylhydantoinase A